MQCMMNCQPQNRKRRNRQLAGFQILDLQDFIGQGTALVGILNAFMENKGLITADDWRSFCSDCVLMLSFPSFVYEELKRAVAEGRKVLFFGTGIRDAYAMIGNIACKGICQ